jgi:hypothetical protein
MELKIISPSEDGFIKSIEFNFDELKGELETRLEKYQGLAYTDETIQDAKKDRATLNKFTEALRAKRIEIKNRCLEPYNAFEAKINELSGMIAEPLEAIATQIKGYEEQKRAEKRTEIEDHWNGLGSNVKALVSLDRIFDPKWLNVGTTMKKIKEAISEFIEKVETELALIEDLGTEFEDQVVRVYLQDFNVAKAMAENKALLEQKGKREEFKRQQEEAARKAAEAAKAQEQPAPASDPEPEPEPQPQAAPVSVKPKAAPPVVKQMDFRVWATSEQLTALAQYLRDNGIKYGRVTDAAA